MSRCFSKFQLHSRELVPSVRPWWEFWFCDRKTQQTPLHLALYQTIWSLVLSFMFCSLKTRYLCPWLHLSVSWGPWGPNTLLFVEFLCSCIASMAYKRPNEFSSDSDDSIVSQTRNAWFVTIQVADGPSPARRTHVAMFPKKYSKDSSGRTFRLLTILGFCGVFPVLARESIFVMGAWKTEFVMGAWKTETNNKTCMAYVPTWIVMMMSRIKASSKWKHCDMPCPTVFREECLEVLYTQMKFQDGAPIFLKMFEGISNLFKVKLRCPRVSPICSIFFWGNPWGYTYGLLYEPKTIDVLLWNQVWPDSLQRHIKLH